MFPSRVMGEIRKKVKITNYSDEHKSFDEHISLSVLFLLITQFLYAIGMRPASKQGHSFAF